MAQFNNAKYELLFQFLEEVKKSEGNVENKLDTSFSTAIYIHSPDIRKILATIIVEDLDLELTEGNIDAVKLKLINIPNTVEEFMGLLATL